MTGHSPRRARALAGRVARRLGGPDPRDAEIADLRARLRRARGRRRRLEAELAQARARLAEPSHQAYLTAAWREWRILRTAGEVEEGRQFDNKLVSYAFAQSHGVPVPRLHERWADLAAIDPVEVAAVPGRMLKSAHGAASHGVVPTDDAAEVAAALARWEELAAPTPPHLDPPIVAPPFFTEERLVPSGDVLVDIKVFAFYGSVAQVMLLSAPDFRSRGAVTMRILDASGADLGAVITTAVVDPAIPVPAHLSEIVAMAERLSLALRRPFVRLDFYDTGDRVVLGEITPMPGNVNRYVVDHDALLGRQWEHAHARLRRDVAAGDDLRVQWGPRPRELSFTDAGPWLPPDGPSHR